MHSEGLPAESAVSLLPFWMLGPDLHRRKAPQGFPQAVGR